MPAFSIDRALQQFAADDKVKIVIVLIAADFILGVCAAVVKGEFRLSYIGNFLRQDVLGKVVPWSVLYVLGKLTDAEIIPVISGIDFAKAATVAFGVIVAALVGSILKSIAELGLAGARDRQAAIELTTKPPENAFVRALVAPEDKPEEVAPAGAAPAVAAPVG